MRLTLRTLLGYLDDILEPQQTKEIGEKISESGFAASTVARIKDVLRRRRVGAPALDGPQSDPDPNVIAEYLDNTLAPDKVEDLERLCLESDMHLAEVAACHQILTLVLHEPVEISQELREQIYALGRTSSDAHPTTPEPVPSAASQPVSEAPLKPIGTTMQTSSDETHQLPVYLKRSSNWKSLLSLAALLLIGGLWIGLIVSDPDHSWSHKTLLSQGEGEAALNANAALAQDSPDGAVAEARPSPAEPASRPDAGPQDASDRSDQGITAPDAAKPSTDAASGPSPAHSVAGTSPSTPPAPSEAKNSTVPVPSEPPAAQAGDGKPESVVQPPQPQVSRVLYNSPDGVLLHQSDSGDWLVMPRRSLLQPGDFVANPEPFDALLVVENDLATITIKGGTRLSVLTISEGVDAAFDVERGRMILRTPLTAVGNKPAVIHLTLYGEDYQFWLEKPGTEMGLVVDPQPSSAPLGTEQQQTFEGACFLTQGEARLILPSGKELQMPSAVSLVSFGSRREPSTVHPSVLTPDWMIPLSGSAVTIRKNYMRMYENEFLLDTPVAETIPALVESRHPRIAEFAVKTLALTDNYTGLIRGLQSPHEEARRAALHGLRVWLIKDPKHQELLRAEVERVYPEEDVSTVLRLIAGFSFADAQDPEVSQQLVEWLMHPNVSVREMAFAYIRDFTGGDVTYRYQADRPEHQRALSARRWQEHVRKEGALVAPSLPESEDETPPVR